MSTVNLLQQTLVISSSNDSLALCRLFKADDFTENACGTKEGMLGSIMQSNHSMVSEQVSCGYMIWSSGFGCSLHAVMLAAKTICPKVLGTPSGWGLPARFTQLTAGERASGTGELLPLTPGICSM